MSSEIREVVYSNLGQGILLKRELAERLHIVVEGAMVGEADEDELDVYEEMAVLIVSDVKH